MPIKRKNKRVIKAWGIIFLGSIFRSEIHNEWARIFKTRKGAIEEYNLCEKDNRDFKLIRVTITIPIKKSRGKK